MRRPLLASLAAAALLVGLGALPAAADTPPPGRLLFIPTSSGSSGVMIRDNAKSTLAIGSGARAYPGKFSSSTGADVLVYTPGAGTDYIAHLSNSIPASVTTTATIPPATPSSPPPPAPPTASPRW